MKKDMETHEDKAVIEYNRIKNKRRIKKAREKMLMQYNKKNELTPEYVPNFFKEIIRKILKFFRIER